jgi:4-amino-4-deoxy-L-arabinose transferase-like glycosyltransferase
VAVKKILWAALAAALFGLVFALSFSRAMRAGGNHDEHQFIASAQLLVEHGLLPYRDYAYFHLPNLIFVYGLLFKFTTYKLLAARLLSAVCVTAMAGLVFYFSMDLFRQASKTMALAAGFGAVFLLLANPLLAYAGTFAWNHSLAMFLALLAAILLWQGARRSRPGWWVLGSGLCLGLAVATRLSFLSALLPFVVGLYFYPGDRPVKRWVGLVVYLSVGFGLAMLPTLLLFAIAPAQFIFGNFTYPNLNTIYRAEIGFFGPPNPMTSFEKLAYFGEQILPQPGNLLLFVALLFWGYTSGLVELWRRKRDRFAFIFILLLAPFVGWGALLPTPAWDQYYAAAVPFAVLAIVLGLAALVRRYPAQSGWFLAIFLQMVILANVYQLGDYRRMTFLLHPEAWRPLIFHELGVQVSELSQGGKVLTLSPLYPLEGGAPIYAEFATGPFAWRTASWLTPPERSTFKMISEEDLEGLLETQAPSAILVGFEPLLEEPLIEYALAHGYSWVELTPESGLWLSPELTLP